MGREEMAWRERQAALRVEQQLKRDKDTFDKVVLQYQSSEHEPRVPPMKLTMFGKANDSGVSFSTTTFLYVHDFVRIVAEQMNVDVKEVKFSVSKELGEKNVFFPSAGCLALLATRQATAISYSVFNFSSPDITSQQALIELSTNEESRFSQIPPEILDAILSFSMDLPEIINVTVHEEYEDARDFRWKYRTHKVTFLIRVSNSVMPRIGETQSIDTTSVILSRPSYHSVGEISEEKTHFRYLRRENLHPSLATSLQPGQSIVQCSKSRLINSPPGFDSDGDIRERARRNPSWMSATFQYGSLRLTSPRFYSSKLDEYLYASCWTPESIVYMKDGLSIRPTPSKLVQPGDLVLCSHRMNYSQLIWARIDTIQISTNEHWEELVNLSDGCQLTSDHPVCVDGTWYHAGELGVGKKQLVKELHNYEIQGGHSVWLGKTLCAPVGVPIRKFEESNPLSRIWGSDYWSITRPKLQSLPNFRFLTKNL